MNTFLQLSCLLLATAGLLAAEVPRKPLPSKYRSLWTESPFTTKPVKTAGPVYNSLQDYVLLGVSPIEEGYRVTMINRKKPKDGRLIIESGRANEEGIKIGQVMRGSGGPLKTRVKIERSGGVSATIGFEEKYLALKPPPAAAKPTRPTNPAQAIRDAANKSQSTRQPRRRILPPTSGGQNNQRSNSSSSQRSRTPTPRTR